MKLKKYTIFAAGLSIMIPALMIFNVYLVKAQETLSVEGQEACGLCHQTIYQHWLVSDHGRATVDEHFLAAWDSEDTACLSCHTTGYESGAGTWKKNGVYCSNCHDANHGNHPDDLMSTDFSSSNCGSCHLETFSDWQKSSHSEVTLNCNNCHNPHMTTLKVDNAQVLCQGCHQEEFHSFDISIHAEQGLLCIDCHLGVEKETAGEGHSKRPHTFIVEVETCVDCHENDYTPTGMIGSISDIESQYPPTSSRNEPLVQNNPQPVGPLGFALLAIFIGLGIGIVLAPWIAPWLRKEFQA